MRIKGAFPVRWAPQPGQDGVGVSILNEYIRYASSTSGTTKPTTGWQTTVPTVAQGNYLWTWVRVVYSDGTETNSYSVSRQGIDGKGIQSSTVTYCQKQNSVSPENIPAGDWGNFPSTLNDGWWLYTKTHIVYSDSSATDSYSVSQVGVGSYYAGTVEYWKAGTSPDTPPEGAPTPGTYVNGQTISTTWSQDRPALNSETPYLWNFEISADSRGNRYVTQAICIGNFAKGISSIQQLYAISSYGSPASGQSYPSDIGANDWQDEQHAAAPTEAKRYQWNKSIVTYNDGTTDISYHVSAVKGIDGKGATYIDLDNENDSMLYDGNGVLLSGSITSNISLYSNGAKIANPPSFSIQSKSSTVTASISGATLTISAITSTSGYVIVQCTYNDVVYTARMTIKKIVGADKYEILPDVRSVTYNTTDTTLSVASVNFKIYRTQANGARNLVTNLASLGLSFKCYPNSLSTNASTISYNGTGKVDVDSSWDNFSVVILKGSPAVELDRETIPINKVANGDVGPGAITLDLDNENDSMLYNGVGTLLSGNVVSQGRLYQGGVDISSQVTSWSLANKANLTCSINASGLVTVTAISADNGSVEVRAVYGGETYKAILTVKKLVGVDKYDIVCTPSAITYNTSNSSGSATVITIRVYRTTQNGARTNISSLPTGFSLDGTFSFSRAYSGGYAQMSVGDYLSSYSSFYVRLRDSNSNLLDYETIPVSKVTNGAAGKGAFILDLDNENDSMLYDGSDTLISGNVVSNASLYEGDTKIQASAVSWACSASNCTASINSSGVVTVTGMAGTVGSVTVSATYGGKTYTAVLSLKKLRGVDKYELVCTPSAVSYNSSTGAPSAYYITVRVYKTSQNGTRENILSLPTGYQLTADGGFYREYSGGYATVNVNTSYSSQVITLKNSASVVLDSETIPICRTANGSGDPGPAARSVYKLGLDTPATPTGNNPSGWSADRPSVIDINPKYSGDFYRGADGYMWAPLIGTGQTLFQTVGFVTSQANQKVYFRAKMNSNYNCTLYIGNLDSGSPTTSRKASISGPNQDTGDLEYTVSTAGYHFICIQLNRASSGTLDYAKFIIGAGFVWQSNAKTYDGNGLVTAWTTPIRVSSESLQEERINHQNLILQSAFLSMAKMGKWRTKNGTVVNGHEGFNAFYVEPEISIDYKEALIQDLCVIGGRQQLKPSTWYTLSFYAKVAEYLQINVYQTSTAYGFAQYNFYAQEGVPITLQFNGYVNSAAYNAGKELRVFIWGPGNSWSGSVSDSVKSTSAQTKTLTYTPPSTGLYHFAAYVYKNGGDTPTSGHTATLNWYKLNRGGRLLSYIYPSSYSDQSSYTPIDVTAGRVKDGAQFGTTSPTDNNAEWNLTTSWLRHTLTFKTRSYIPSGSNHTLIFRLAQASNPTYICMPKLEEGTQVTDFNESIEDINGADGCILRRTEWAVGIQYRNDENVEADVRYLDIAIIRSGTTWKAWQAKEAHNGVTSSNSNKPQDTETTYWKPLNNMTPTYTPLLLADNALITFAQSNRILVMKSDGVTVAAGMGGAPGGDSDFPLWVGASYDNRATANFRVTLAGIMYAKGCHISGDSTFEGTLSGVTGSFKKLQAINSSGQVKAEIGFNSSEGKLYFEGDMQHQGYDSANNRSYRFLTADLWCRGIFGARERAAIVVYWSYAYVYTKGFENSASGVYIPLTSETYDGHTVYTIPCYSPRYDYAGDTAGFPIDLIILRPSSNAYYRLSMATSQRVMVVNGNDSVSAHICVLGHWLEWKGGELAEVVQLPIDKINPTQASTVIGAGQLVGAFRDNNWS